MLASSRGLRARYSFWLVLALFGAAAGCGKRSPSPGTPAGPGQVAGGRGGVLHVGNYSEPEDLDSQTVTGIPERRILMALFEGLLTLDPKDLHLMPGLARSWDISADGLVYTFHLRDHLRWSNGDPLTADDFVQSYRRILTPTLGSQYSYLLWFAAGAEDFSHGTIKDFNQVGFKALDPTTLQVTLRQPTPFLLKIIATHYAWNAVPTRVIAKFGPLDRKSTNWTRAGNLVGTGPFLLKEWIPNQKVVVVRNPNYWDAANVKLDEIDFIPTEDLPTEERMFRTGQLEITAQLPAAKVDVYRKERPQDLHIDPYAGVYYYRCNVTRPPLNDKRIRRALALAIDRESLVKNVTRAGEQPAYAVSYPDDSGYTAKARLSGGLEEARRLLAEAGFPGGKGLAPLQLLYNTSDNNRAVAEAIQAMWHKLGVDVELQNEEWKVYLDAQHTQNYQMQRAGWIADYADPNVFLEIWVTANGNNDTLWSNAEYDRLAAAALRAKTEAERYDDYQKMDAILVDECPVIPIYYYTRPYAMSPRVKGYASNILDNHPWKYVSLEGQ